MLQLVRFPCNDLVLNLFVQSCKVRSVARLGGGPQLCWGNDLAIRTSHGFFLQQNLAKGSRVGQAAF
jgi:hypothetical protein